jgi:hypothetical protein
VKNILFLLVLIVVSGCAVGKRVVVETTVKPIDNGATITSTVNETSYYADTDIIEDGTLGSLISAYTGFTAVGCKKTEKELGECIGERNKVEAELKQCKSKPLPTDPEDPNKPKDPEDVAGELIMDHTNGLAWHGKGVALTQCITDQIWDECTFNGKGMTGHAGRDYGRHTWSIDKSTVHKGTITCKYGDKTGAWKVEERVIPGKCYRSHD